MTTQTTEAADTEAATPIADAVERDLAVPYSVSIVAGRTWTACACGSLASHSLDGRGPVNVTMWQNRHRSCPTTSANTNAGATR